MVGAVRLLGKFLMISLRFHDDHLSTSALEGIGAALPKKSEELLMCSSSCAPEGAIAGTTWEAQENRR